MKINVKNIIIYILGIVLMSLAVALTKRTILGMGAWDAVIANIQILTKIKLGYASLIINLSLLTFVIIYKRSFKFLLVIIPISINMLFLNFWDSFVFADVVFKNILIQILIFGISALILPLGLSFIIYSTLPKMIYDEVTFIIMNIFKTNNFGYVRLGFEVFAVLLAMGLGAIGGNVLSMIGPGTIIMSICIGPLISFYLKVLDGKFIKNNTEFELEEVE